MNTVQYKCPNCGAELTFDPEHQNFSCEYCDSTYTEAEMQQLMLRSNMLTVSLSFS